MAFRLRTYSSLVAAVVALAVVLSGCTSSTEVETIAPNAAVYGLVIVDVIDRSGVELDSSDALPMVFVEAFDTDGIALDVQVDVINDLIEQYEIRFIDEHEEAIAVDLAGLPVRENSLLIGLGPLVHDDNIDIRIEVYQSMDAIRAYRYTLAGSEDRWDFVGVPEEIEPEGFVAAP